MNQDWEKTLAEADDLQLRDALAQAQEVEKDWKWDKSVCRFCGTGCGLMIATRNDKVNAVTLEDVNRVAAELQKPVVSYTIAYDARDIAGFIKLRRGSAPDGMPAAEA